MTYGSRPHVQQDTSILSTSGWISHHVDLSFLPTLSHHVEDAAPVSTVREKSVGWSLKYMLRHLMHVEHRADEFILRPPRWSRTACCTDGKSAGDHQRCNIDLEVGVVREPVNSGRSADRRTHQPAAGLGTHLEPGARKLVTLRYRPAAPRRVFQPARTTFGVMGSSTRPSSAPITVMTAAAVATEERLTARGSAMFLMTGEGVWPRGHLSLRRTGWAQTSIGRTTLLVFTFRLRGRFRPRFPPVS